MEVADWADCCTTTTMKTSVDGWQWVVGSMWWALYNRFRVLMNTLKWEFCRKHAAAKPPNPAPMTTTVGIEVVAAAATAALPQRIPEPITPNCKICKIQGKSSRGRTLQLDPCDGCSTKWLVRASPAVLSSMTRLQKYFSHPSLVNYLFPTPPIRLKLGVQIGGRLLQATHLD